LLATPGVSIAGVHEVGVSGVGHATGWVLGLAHRVHVDFWRAVSGTGRSEKDWQRKRCGCSSNQ
jgi:hypothetical protein